MLVKFLKSGRFAFSPPSHVQIEYVEGEEANGIPEVDAEIMMRAGVAEVLGSDAEAATEKDDDDSDDGDSKSGESSRSPWDRN